VLLRTVTGALQGPQQVRALLNTVTQTVVTQPIWRFDETAATLAAESTAVAAEERILEPRHRATISRH
jgi:hypothetical protein